jgi:hypothetical protein
MPSSGPCPTWWPKVWQTVLPFPRSHGQFLVRRNGCERSGFRVHRVKLNPIYERVLVDRPGVRGAPAQRLAVRLARSSDIPPSLDENGTGSIESTSISPRPTGSAALLDPRRFHSRTVNERQSAFGTSRLLPLSRRPRTDGAAHGVCANCNQVRVLLSAGPRHDSIREFEAG